MVNSVEVNRQLKQIGADFRYWGRGEASELSQILLPQEMMQVAVMGRYAGGFAMLVASDQRLLLIDKKPLYLTLEDIRYDMVAEVDYRHQLIDATVNICTLNKELRFTSTKKPTLRMLTSFIQQRVGEIRQHQQQYQPVMPANPAQKWEVQGNPIRPVMVNPSMINPYSRQPLIMRRRFSPFDNTRY